MNSSSLQLPTCSLQPATCNLLLWLFEQQKKGISLGLDAVASLLAVLGHPEKKCSVFHIAGTNGKGSVAAFSESILRAAGCRTGLYTSPHLVDFKERIRVNGEPIGSDALEEGIKGLQWATRGWNTLPTFFELTTALAFDHFARSECDVIVLETGLGGRLDATNLAAKKIACAITPISLDHQALLGPTLSHIAREKAGIMRSGVPVITVPQSNEVIQVLQEEAARVGAPLKIISEPLAASASLGLAGSHQRWNAALALALVRQGPWSFSQETVKQGMITVSWPGRFQQLTIENNNRLQISTSPTAKQLVLDGAHNPAAAEQLVQTWKEEFPDQRYTLIFGTLADKEGAAMLRILEPLAASIMLVPVASPRSAVPQELLRVVPVATTFSSLEAALKKAVTLSENSSQEKITRSTPVLLTGSLFLVGEALALLQGEHYSPSMQ